jgi:hypothetical protein
MAVINATTLTTLTVAPDGSMVSINVAEADGAPASLVLPSDALRSLIMSLPPLMQQALRLRYRDPSLRLVYPLGTWRLESSTEAGRLLLALATSDGFEVTFSIAVEELKRIADAAARAHAGRKPPPN